MNKLDRQCLKKINNIFSTSIITFSNHLGYLTSFGIFIISLLSPTKTLAQHLPGDTIQGTNGYVEYLAGDLPIIISAPHGGYLTPTSIPNRSCTGCVTSRDNRTEELAYEINKVIPKVFGGHPHVIINKLARIKFDANRAIGEAALGNPEAETAWHEYHNFIQAAKDSCVAKYGSAIFIDLHGHGHDIQRIELGYLLNKDILQLPNSTLDANNSHNSCSIRHLKDSLNPMTSFAELLRGTDCMGEYLVKRGYPSVPSATDPFPLPEDPYFTGGYNTVRHGSRDSSVINAIQFELNWMGLRQTTRDRTAFAHALSCAIRSYLDRWYFDLDTWDPGHIVTSTADAGPGSLRSTLLGAEDGTVITFDSELYGDTIHLKGELQICSDIVLKGLTNTSITISGDNVTRIFRVTHGNNAEMLNLNLVNGYTTEGEDGGAILCYGELKMVNCILSTNYAGGNGGAIALGDSTAQITLDSCLIKNNRCSDMGGGISCLKGNLKINSCTIQGNVAATAGGGLSLNDNVTLTNSTFYANEAGSLGGGIYSYNDGNLTCSNTTIAENINANMGAGINSSGTVNLNFCTIVMNKTKEVGGGIRVGKGGLFTIKNTLIATNTGGSNHNDVSVYKGELKSLGHNFIGDTTGSSWVADPTDFLGNVTNPLDPLISDLGPNGGQTNTVALLDSSPCIDKANDIGAPPFDQRGNNRIFNSKPDIGSYEYCDLTSSRDIQYACGPFTWIDGITYITSNDTATFNTAYADGCDSVVTLNLTITDIDNSITQDGSMLSATIDGATYQWLDCNNNYEPLSGQTNQDFTPILNGSYAVEITQNGCVDTSACYLITQVGLIENDFGKDLKIFPNPTNGRFNVNLGDNYSEIELKIYNAFGQILKILHFSNTQDFETELVDPPGFYLIQIKSNDNKKARFSIIKQ